MTNVKHLLLIPAVLAAFGLLAACGGDNEDDAATPSGELSGRLVVYSGRTESLIGPLLTEFEEKTGVDVDVRYGSTPQVAAAILEEGDRTPADVYIGQDAGSLGLLASEGVFAPLPADILDRVPQAFRARAGDWIGLSGRVRVVVYNTDSQSEDTLPDSILDYTDPAWRGKIGWAPTNGSFQSFVTAMRVLNGEDATREWLEGIVANDAVTFPGNAEIVTAVAAGEIEVGFVNHYYLGRFLAEQGEGFKARNYYFANGDLGGLMNVAGAGVLKSSEHEEAALALIRFMLSDESQEHFATETFEFPLVEGIEPPADFVPELDTLATVDIDLTDLADAEGTVALLQDVGAIE